jgi:hypothetical protein
MMRLCWTPLLLLACVPLRAQPLAVQPCPFDALDATFQAVDGPDKNYTLALNLRNISGEKCWMGTYPGGTGMAPDPAPDGTWVKICYRSCEQDDQEPSDARITLAPGEWVHQTRRWRTSPAEVAAKCVSLTDMGWDKTGDFNSYYWLFSRSLLKPICSPLWTTDYAPGQFLPDTVTSLAPGSRVPVLHWANDESVSNTREHVPLRVTVEDPGHLLSFDERSCPRLFVRVRDATPSQGMSRATRVDEVHDVTCKMESAGASGMRFAIDFDASYALTRKNDADKGEYTVDASSLAEIKGHYLLVSTTNDLHLSMVDGKFIRRNWDPPVEGVAVSLTLDKDVYDLGSEIPLHIALENFSSRTSIFAMDPYWDPPGAGVELQDSNGHPIPLAGGGWGGHGFCHHFLPGLVFPVELTLGQMGFRPDHPGIYKVIATWSPSRNGGCGWVAPAPADHLAVRSFPVTFRLVAKATKPESASPKAMDGNKDHE